MCSGEISFERIAIHVGATTIFTEGLHIRISLCQMMRREIRTRSKNAAATRLPAVIFEAIIIPHR